MRYLACFVAAALIPATACTIAIPGTDSLFSTGSSFVLSGTSTVLDTDNGTCLVWVAGNGVTYYLFQDPKLDNDLFDRVTEPGTTSRLEIALRNDLEVTCFDGPVAEVQDVLEVVE